MSTDLVFAWIDSIDCFGTIAEISFAFAFANRDRLKNKSPLIVLASPPSFAEDAAHLWFVMGMANKQVVGSDTAGEAWEKLWTTGQP